MNKLGEEYIDFESIRKNYGEVNGTYNPFEASSLSASIYGLTRYLFAKNLDCHKKFQDLLDEYLKNAQKALINPQDQRKVLNDIYGLSPTGGVINENAPIIKFHKFKDSKDYTADSAIEKWWELFQEVKNYNPKFINTIKLDRAFEDAKDAFQAIRELEDILNCVAYSNPNDISYTKDDEGNYKTFTFTENFEGKVQTRELDASNLTKDHIQYLLEKINISMPQAKIIFKINFDEYKDGNSKQYKQLEKSLKEEGLQTITDVIDAVNLVINGGILNQRNLEQYKKEKIENASVPQLPEGYININAIRDIFNADKRPPIMYIALSNILRNASFSIIETEIKLDSELKNMLFNESYIRTALSQPDLMTNKMRYMQSLTAEIFGTDYRGNLVNLHAPLYGENKDHTYRSVIYQNDNFPSVIKILRENNVEDIDVDKYQYDIIERNKGVDSIQELYYVIRMIGNSELDTLNIQRNDKDGKIYSATGVSYLDNENRGFLIHGDQLLNKYVEDVLDIFEKHFPNISVLDKDDPKKNKLLVDYGINSFSDLKRAFKDIIKGENPFKEIDEQKLGSNQRGTNEKEAIIPIAEEKAYPWGIGFPGLRSVTLVYEKTFQSSKSNPKLDDGTIFGKIRSGLDLIYQDRSSNGKNTNILEFHDLEKILTLIEGVNSNKGEGVYSGSRYDDNHVLFGNENIPFSQKQILEVTSNTLDAFKKLTSDKELISEFGEALNRLGDYLSSDIKHAKNLILSEELKVHEQDGVYKLVPANINEYIKAALNDESVVKTPAIIKGALSELQHEMSELLRVAEEIKVSVGSEVEQGMPIEIRNPPAFLKKILDQRKEEISDPIIDKYTDILNSDSSLKLFYNEPKNTLSIMCNKKQLTPELSELKGLIEDKYNKEGVEISLKRKGKELFIRHVPEELYKSLNEVSASKGVN